MVDIYLRKLELTDVTEDYLSWMNDYETVKYTESRFMQHSKESLIQFVKNANNSGNNYFFAIIDKKSGKHIGNIKIGNINSYHRFGDIGLIIGDKNFWGKGVATTAIKLCVDIAFKQLRLNRLSAGIYDLNIGSIKAFEKAGFVQESCEKSKYIFEAKFIDSYVYSIINNEI